MEMDLVGIKNQNEYYTNHYFTSIFKENAEDTIKEWKAREKEEEIQFPWKKLREISRKYYRIRDRYLHTKSETASKPQVQELAELYLNALGYENRKSVTIEVADGITVPVYHEETKANGAPLLWSFLCVAGERGDDILQGKIFAKSDDEDEVGESVDLINDDILAKLLFVGEEAPRFIILIGINQIALIDRNKWNEKRYLQFMMEDIFSRHEESTFMAITVLLHKESLCSNNGVCVLDNLDESSHKHSAAVSDALKYALRECIEILGNEVIYDMKNRQGINLSEKPVDASELTLECLRYMYRFLFMLFIEARPELGYAPMKSQTYVQGYSLEGLRDVCDRVKEASEAVSEGYYIDDTLKELFHMTYYGYPEKLEDYKKAIEIEKESMHDVFTIEALKAHIFDPEYTKLITKARLRNCAMLQIVDLMSISRPTNAKERRGRISYSALGINQMGAVYEALLSYRGFIAEETLFEVKRKGEKFNELDVGYFIPERELDNYEEDERVRYEKGDKKGQLRKYESGTFIYRLAGREREKSASYYTPEVLTKCLVKYALKELLKDKTADEILNLTICEPAMGSAAFLNEAINQLAEAYLNKKQEELGKTIAYDQRFEELQKVKMFIADRNVYGVDLNPIAVELAEVSLWLNTIYKGAYVPWFGTQLVCGNSLIGARREVYYTSKLENGTWYKEAPDRIMPGEKRKKVGVSNRVYHFLLGDPGMANYTDKVIKNLEPDNIKIINNWRKEFTKSFDEEDIKTVLRLSDTIDILWDKTVELRKKVKKATFEPLSVFGHDEIEQGSHTTIREKDEIYQKLFKSEHMSNAGPYARLKAAMDYWCALWFWPIDKADLLPTRQEFFMEMSLILEGTLGAIVVNKSGQLSLIDASGNQFLDEKGNERVGSNAQQLALDFQDQYAELGIVNLDHLRDTSKKETDTALRLNLVKKIADEQRFQHWELEFADVFEESKGFDLVIGNPPWLPISWNEQNVLADFLPIITIRNLTAIETTKKRINLLQIYRNKCVYLNEYVSITAELNFFNSLQNYELLKGIKPNLYKCFLPISWMISTNTGVSALVHPEGIYNDSNGEQLRKTIYGKLRYLFQFENELNLFTGTNDHGRLRFALNIYNNEKKEEGFYLISNLFSPITIDQCFEEQFNEAEVPGIKDDNNNWCIKGHKNRIIFIGKNELEILAKILDEDAKSCKLLFIHASQLLEVLKKFSEVNIKIGNLKGEICGSMMWQETGAQKDNIIRRDVSFPDKIERFVCSGPHFGVGNPFNKTPRRVCKFNGDYDVIDLLLMPQNYIPRTNYVPACDVVKYTEMIPITPWGERYHQTYRLINRAMLSLSSERTMNCAILQKGAAHIHTVFGLAFQDNKKLLDAAACMTSLPYDFLIRVSGKGFASMDLMSKMPIVSSKRLRVRILLLNCLTSGYADLWNSTFDKEYAFDEWGKTDNRLEKNMYANLKKEWSPSVPVKSDFARRQIMVEIDVLVAMELGLTLGQLLTVYNLQFPVLKANDSDTWYDQNGRIVFTNNRSLTGVGLPRPEWEKIKTAQEGVFSQTIEDDTMPGGTITRTIEYIAPFDRCDREKDYAEVWHTFEDQFSKSKN